ncbi:hypothetical protein AaE_008108 [Aphanomyces astaci]|uniref:BED-type domain-containing protein n=1 Tax=Aphanomyces astaci TaxID=112090 RepID=A0A6A5A0T5_APHAT|nr:hypothetical protein AaE_008108 [Aphanomyces astaci]
MESRQHNTQINNDNEPSPSSKRRKTMPNTSFIWKHFQRSEDKSSIACVHCLPMGATVFAYSGGTSTMTRHLRRKHGIFAPGKSEQDYERPSSTVPSFTTAMLTSFFDKSDEGGGGEPYRPPKCAGHNNVMAHTSRYLKLQHTRHTMQWIQFATTQYTSLHLDADLHTVLRKGANLLTFLMV